MRQLIHIRVLFVGIISILIVVGCQSLPVNNFHKIKVNMTKDEVLEIAGSPNRTERFEGKEKWAYRFYTDEEKDQWDHRQVTFVDGKVVSVGEDVDEESRLKSMNAEDRARDERRKNFKLAPAVDPSLVPTGSVEANPKAESSVPDPVVPKESDFVEMKGHRGATQSAPSHNSGGDESEK